MKEVRTQGTDPSPASLTRYIYSNHLQSASLELDENATIISYEEYHPYGTTSYQASNTAINAVAKRYRYTGKERDEESGLYYYGARYYIPWLCRWTAVDPMEAKYAGITPYNYAFDNPVIWNDPSGKDPNVREQINGNDPSDIDNEKKVGLPKSESDSIHIYFFNLGNSDPKFQEFMSSFTQDDFHNIRTAIYERYMTSYTSNFARAIYGTNRNGEVNIPEPIKEKYWDKSGNELYNALKEVWTAQVSGSNPNSLNPLHNINWKYHRARAVTSREEGLAMIKGVAFDVTLAYVLGPKPKLNAVKSTVSVSSNIATKKVSAEGAVWAQTDFGLKFSAGGKFAGKTVDDIAEALRNGMPISEVQIDVIVRNGQTFILNTRSSVALTKAGVPRSSWNVVNQTGVELYENMLTNQLLKNNLPNGTRTIFQRGTNKTISLHE